MARVARAGSAAGLPVGGGTGRAEVRVGVRIAAHGGGLRLGRAEAVGLALHELLAVPLTGCITSVFVRLQAAASAGRIGRAGSGGWAAAARRAAAGGEREIRRLGREVVGGPGRSRRCRRAGAAESRRAEAGGGRGGAGCAGRLHVCEAAVFAGDVVEALLEHLVEAHGVVVPASALHPGSRRSDGQAMQYSSTLQVKDAFISHI